MDEINQNSNLPSSLQTPPVQANPMPPMPQMPMSKKSHSALWVVIFALVAIGGFAWWYIGQMVEEPLVVDAPKKIDQEARQDALISQQLNAVDTGNLDAEFKPIDGDINSL